MAPPCRHLIFPLMAPGRTGFNDTYHPVVACVRCGEELETEAHLEEAFERAVARGLSPGSERHLRRQFAMRRQGGRP